MNNEEKIFELIEELFEFYEEDDWLKVKKYLLRYLHPDLRKLFSTRHAKTKKHSLNNFEKDLIDKCQNIYNRKLILKEKDKHCEET
tara:strand:- start:3234 stop:3491 length:258 start_codon:yes stop_codon:yes gene_type:complete